MNAIVTSNLTALQTYHSIVLEASALAYPISWLFHSKYSLPTELWRGDKLYTPHLYGALQREADYRPSKRIDIALFKQDAIF